MAERGAGWMNKRGDLKKDSVGKLRIQENHKKLCEKDKSGRGQITEWQGKLKGRLKKN
jgi:hypothetical protein